MNDWLMSAYALAAGVFMLGFALGVFGGWVMGGLIH